MNRGTRRGWGIDVNMKKRKNERITVHSSQVVHQLKAKAAERQEYRLMMKY
jgi:hypothetical protein